MALKLFIVSFLCRPAPLFPQSLDYNQVYVFTIGIEVVPWASSLEVIAFYVFLQRWAHRRPAQRAVASY